MHAALQLHLLFPTPHQLLVWFASSDDAKNDHTINLDTSTDLKLCC
jgi:hypothetical protein